MKLFIKKFTFLSILFLHFVATANAQVIIHSSAPPVQVFIQQQNVKVIGRQLLVDFDQNGIYDPYLVKATGYHPTPFARHPSDWGYPPGDPRLGNPNFPNNIFDDTVILDRDFAMLQAMKANTIRIWGGQDNTEIATGRFPNKLTQRTLNKAQQYGLKVIAGFWMPHPGDWSCSNGGAGPRVYNANPLFSYANPTDRANIKQKFRNYVAQFKNHPAILFWAIGNEENLHLRDAAHAQQFYSLINEMAQEARLEEGPPYHPVAAMSGDLGYIGVSGIADDATMNFIEIWGSNVYRGATFGNFFASHAVLTQKPSWISEFGEDAWHSNSVVTPQNGYEDQFTQALRVYLLWTEIQQNFSSTQPTTIGGSVMEYSDEWWKPYEWLCGTNSPMCNSVQDHFGTGPVDTSCPLDGVPDYYPPSVDQFFNDEWWGVVAIQRNPLQPNHDNVIPRLVYLALQYIW